MSGIAIIMNEYIIFVMKTVFPFYFLANCSFDGSFCGWRNVIDRMFLDGLTWRLGTSPNVNNSNTTKGS